MRKIGTLTATFGLLNFEVAINTIQQREDKIAFVGLNAETGNPRKIKWIDSKTGQEVKEVVKGYKIGKEYVKLTKEELDSVERLDNGIEVLGFMSKSDINDNEFSTPYFTEPTSSIGKKIYALLADSLTQLNYVAVARTIFRGNEHLSILKPHKRGLILQYLFPCEAVNNPDMAEVNDGDLKQLQQIIKANTLKTIGFTNTYSEKVKQLIMAKAEGKTIKLPETKKAKEEANVAEMLKAMATAR